MLFWEDVTYPWPPCDSMHPARHRCFRQEYGARSSMVCRHRTLSQSAFLAVLSDAPARCGFDWQTLIGKRKEIGSTVLQLRTVPPSCRSAVKSVPLNASPRVVLPATELTSEPSLLQTDASRRVNKRTQSRHAR